MDKSNPNFILIGVLFVAAFIFITVRRKSLTLGGASTAAFMGIWVVFFAGVQWLIPLFFFFISGTLLGKLNTETEVASDEKHGKGRDAWQVICNGFPYAFLATFIGTQSFYEWSLLLTFVSISIAVADTWSSEIGMYFRGKTIDILRLKKQQPGVSGGVSWAGTLGGLAGAFCSAVISVLLAFRALELHMNDFELTLIVTGVISLAGFLGMLIDSIIGSAFQLKYKNPRTGDFSDTASAENTEHVGISWFTNDVVNLVSNLLGTSIFALFLYLYLGL